MILIVLAFTVGISFGYILATAQNEKSMKNYDDMVNKFLDKYEEVLNKLKAKNSP